MRPTLGDVAVLLLATTGAFAGDWPQILGPQRNGIAQDESLANSWPAGGPKIVWTHDVGSGFAGVAVASRTAVVFHRLSDREVVEAHDAKSGELIWKISSATAYVPSFSPDDGPRCTPVIHKGRIITFGAQGVLQCLDLKSGRRLWSRQTHKDFDAKEGYFGAGSTPIVEAGRLLVNVGGGRSGAGIVAFDLDTGKTLWKQTSEQASYSSPVATTIGGQRHVIFVTRYKALSLEPKTGRVRFELRFGARGPTVNGASPVVVDGHLFLTASYRIGAVWAKIGQAAATEVWRSDDILSSQYTTPIAHAGKLFGIHGRQDGAAASLRCFDPKTRRVHWTKRGFGYATLIKADGKLVILKTDGTLLLAKPDPTGYRELARAKLFASGPRYPSIPPALSNGRLFVRDRATLRCVDLGR